VDAELVIVGAGPAGVAAALRARTLELDALVLEAGERPGGQLHAVHFHPHDVPGFEAGDGAVLAQDYARQLAAAAVRLRTGVRAERLDAGGGAPAVHLAGGGRLSARAVLIASGARRRTLGVPGERELEDRGVSYSATRDRERLAGRRVVVVGGGDAAHENALLLAAAGSTVTLLVRGIARARVEFRGRVAREARIRVCEHATVLSIEGDGAVNAVRWRDGAGDHEEPVEGVVIKVGVLPGTEWCRGAIATDADGFARVGADLATSAPHVWACGDVVRPLPPSVAVAIGQGTQAVAAIRAALRAGSKGPGPDA